jgi:hypothetical protein
MSRGERIRRSWLMLARYTVCRFASWLPRADNLQAMDDCRVDSALRSVSSRSRAHTSDLGERGPPMTTWSKSGQSRASVEAT